MQELAPFQGDGQTVPSFVSLEYHLHLMPGSLVVADTQERSKQKNPLKMTDCLLGRTRTPVTLEMCSANCLFWW